MTFNVKITNSVCQIPETEWNAIAGEEFCYSHLWQRLLETHLHSFYPRYIFVYHHECPVAAAISMIPPPPYFFMKNLPPLVQPLFDQVVSRVFAFCALPFNSRLNGIILSPHVTNKDEIITYLLNTLDQQTRWRIQTYLSAEGADTALHQALVQRGYVSIPASSYARLHIKPWQTFADYLQDLPAKKHRGIRRERRRAQECDVTIKCMRPGEMDVTDAELYRMFCNVMSRHNVLHPWLDVVFLLQFAHNWPKTPFIFVLSFKTKLLGSAWACTTETPSVFQSSVWTMKSPTNMEFIS